MAMMARVTRLAAFSLPLHLPSTGLVRSSDSILRCRRYVSSKPTSSSSTFPTSSTPLPSNGEEVTHSESPTPSLNSKNKNANGAKATTEGDVLTDDRTSPPTFKIVSHTPIFSRYQTVYQRDVRFPNGNLISFDVLGNARSNYTSVFVFPFDTRTRTATLIREYAPGANAETFSLVAGMFDPQKHASVHEAARAELSEEARLCGGTLHPLTQAPIRSDKYSLNRFFYFLAIDCIRDETPMQRDAEEWISEVKHFSLAQVDRLVADGEINTPNSLCALLALRRLAEMGYIP